MFLCCVRVDHFIPALLAFVAFSFFSTKPRDWLGITSRKWPILCREEHKILTQSINQLKDCIKQTDITRGGSKYWSCDTHVRIIRTTRKQTLTDEVSYNQKNGKCHTHTHTHTHDRCGIIQQTTRAQHGTKTQSRMYINADEAFKSAKYITWNACAIQQTDK